MAVKNSNDSMSLAQTAEGAMEEVTNMLQRIRELAVQSSNGTMNSSDRASLDAEVQALKAEIDRVATTTTFNSQNLLDGSYKATFQIGDKGGQTVGLQIGSVLTSSLGMGEGSAGANSVVSARVNFADVDAGDIVINGQALGAISATDHMEDVVQNINDNVDNVKASAFNVVVAENVGNGITGGNGVAASGTFSKTFEVTQDKLVAGHVIEINGSAITLGSARTVDDLVTQVNSVTSQTGITASADGANVTLVGEVDSVNIAYQSEAEIEAGFTSTTTQDSAAINKQGATANTSDGQTSTIVLAAGDVVEGRTYRLEITKGANSTAASDIDVSYTAVSGDTNATVLQGLRDEMIRNHTQLLGAASSTIDVTGTPGSMIFSASLDYGVSTFDFGIDETAINKPIDDSVIHNARLKLDSVNNTPIKIDLGQNTTSASHEANHGLLESGVGAADFDVNEPTLSAAGGTSMSGLTVSDAASATKALGTIDNAIDTVNSIRGDLGALQNRLEYTINNLSSISNATTGARGRILDADFAKTTSELTKHQILTQAATSMLAQANQSKQGILALLQG
jgi:flagellin